MEPDISTLLDYVHQDYPKIQQYGIQLIDSIGKRKSPHGGAVEFYPADESENPNPGKHTIEMFEPGLSMRDILGETLHILPKIDPYVGSIKHRFESSMTEAQQARLRKQYDYAQTNYGEKRSFEDWRDISGLDGWFRGYISRQWPAEVYTQDQIRMFDELENYLKKP